MAKIHILSEQLRNRIAAGEVVERPASIVKELIENSIDACAERISVEVQGAGKDLIRVSDDGEGMDAEDLHLAVCSHATSKITSIDDLFDINTLGFRGEALSSIASVSNFKITSRTSTDKTASFIEIEGGRTIKEGKTSCSWSTVIEVKNLFCNVLPRRKFLKHDNTEFTHIVDIVTRFAISHPEVEFILTSNGKKMLDLKKSGFSERIKELFPQMEDKLIYLKSENSLFTLQAFLSKPELNYPRRVKQYVFVNNRPVVSPLVYHALDESYRGLIEGRNYPAAFLFMGIAPSLIDVNVHPTKKEIKFKRESEVHDLLRGILKDELQGESVVTTMDVQTSNRQTFYQPDLKEIGGGFIKEQEGSFFNLPQKAECLGYKNRYIVWLDEEGINILDQHAGWEKVLYEKFLSCLENRQPEVQKLLLPEVINLNLKEAIFLKDNFEVFNKLGFEIKEFGENSFVLHTRPVFLQLGSKEIIKEVISEIIADGEAEDKLSKMAASLACHAAIKSGDSLTKDEVANLITEVKNLKTPYCPHGRPVLIRITWNDLEKQFGRK